jgi:hypothetical protein
MVVGLVSSCLCSILFALGEPLSWSPELSLGTYVWTKKKRALFIEPVVRISVLELRLMDCGGGTGFLQTTVLESLGCIWFNRTESKDRLVVAQKYVHPSLWHLSCYTSFTVCRSVPRVTSLKYVLSSVVLFCLDMTVANEVLHSLNPDKKCFCRATL